PPPPPQAEEITNEKPLPAAPVAADKEDKDSKESEKAPNAEQEKEEVKISSTYGHSQLKTGHPVRSAIHKQLNGRLVLRWVTTW
ncbi:hypothetical protein KCU67_g16070, partial [Aureobasidium melanogenum]